MKNLSQLYSSPTPKKWRKEYLDNKKKQFEIKGRYKWKINK